MANRNLVTGHEQGCPCCSFTTVKDVTRDLDSFVLLDIEAPVDETGAEVSADTLPFRLDDYAGSTYRGKLIADQDRIIEQIDAGRMMNVADNTISFGFLEKDHALGVYNNPEFGFRQPGGMSPFSEAQKAATRESMAHWDDLIPQDIIEKKGANGADILFTNTTTGPAQASAYYPGNGMKYQGDVWVATPSENWTNDWLGFNGYGATTIIHEAGHALGLSHPGAYNFGPGFAVTYANGAEYAQDSEQFSIMSYWAPSETGAIAIDFRTFQFGNGQTPMIHDILTIQAKYGADLTTRADDTVYGYNSTAGKDVYDMNKNPFPLLAIYDAGGNDTIDMSGTGAGVFIDLRDGSFSSAAADMPTVAEINEARNELFELAGLSAPVPFTQARADATEAFYKAQIAGRIEANTDVAGIQAMGHMNLSIAYGTIIENAIGSSERDLLVGNNVANKLTGNAGNDVLNGLGGDDLLVGGAGNDTFVFGEGQGGIDTILDFETGKDKIDLSEFGITAEDVTFDGGKIFAEVDGGTIEIIVQGDRVDITTDIFFG